MNLSAVRGIGLLFILCAHIAAASPNDVTLVLDDSVQRVESAPAMAPAMASAASGREAPRPAVLSHARVDLEIDTVGNPFSLKAPAGLPDDVVRSLVQWRFEPAKKNGQWAFFDVALIIPLTGPVTVAPEPSVLRNWHRSATEDEGRNLNQASAAAIETAVFFGEQDWTARVPLLSYALEGADVTLEEARRIRARNIAWLVENHPEAPILGSPFALIHPSDGPLADAEAHQSLRDLWLRHLEPPSASPEILDHAVNFLRISNPEQCERRLLAEPDINDLAGQWLGEVYGLALLGVTGFDPKTGLPSSAGARVPRDGFAKNAAAALRSTSAARVVLSAMQTMMYGARALAVGGKLPAGYASVCEPLLERTKRLFPDTSATCNPFVAVSDVEEPRTTVRVGGRTQSAHLIKSVAPTYPSAARDRGIHGSVRFDATIGVDGSIRCLNLVSGPLALYESARDAVRQWKYKPTILDHRPVQVQTVIDVEF
jgi:hypothetical protein